MVAVLKLGDHNYERIGLSAAYIGDGLLGLPKSYSSGFKYSDSDGKGIVFVSRS